MKFLDEVKVIVSKEEYEKQGVFKGMIGTIFDGEIRNREFNVLFYDKTPVTPESWGNIKEDIFCAIKIKDLEFVKDGNCSDELIIDALPKNDLRWFCKVENGFIINLLGDKLNKIPYDYDS